jgi:hypothetical protein
VCNFASKACLDVNPSRAWNFANPTVRHAREIINNDDLIVDFS